MGSNSFGKMFTVTTFGESHGEGIGCVIDGCPAGIYIDEEMINRDMKKRRPGFSPYVSPRKELDEVQILSGVFENKTTGTPIMMWIENKNHKSSSYDEVKNVIRIGHGNYTYLKKYGIYDYRGGGRASARETAARVAAGAVAKTLLGAIKIKAKIIEVGGEKEDFSTVLKKVMEEGDSVGGVIECVISNVPAGLGEPIYEKVEANLASAMLSINACKGVEFGEGFNAARMKGSEHNDEMEDGKFLSNHHGGILAGITTGEDIIFRVAFKPTSTIKKPMKTMTLDGQNTVVMQKTNVRTDPCVAIRAPAIVESMSALVLVDFILHGNT
ncbi:MAG: Chorismate synthase [Chlamydiia bacterium]|nr:Chorismate synthase [Chlamydiia bacterium]